MLHEFLIIYILSFLDDNSKWNLALASRRIFDIFRNSSFVITKFTLNINCDNFEDIFENKITSNIPLHKMSIISNGSLCIQKVSDFLNRYRNSLTNLEIIDFKFKHDYEFIDIFKNLSNLKSIKLNNCQIEKSNEKVLNPISTLVSLTFIKCNDNVFKIFTKQKSLEKVFVSNGIRTWNGFPHKIFNEICKNCKNLWYLKLDGVGTGSYFDSDNFPYKIIKLDAEMITYNWYVGIRTRRIEFLESQKDVLQELTIQELPYDFDGGGVLKYIFDEMNLSKFYYRNTALILDGYKQNVNQFEFCETQITSAYEMVKQFSSINKIIFRISSSDIASDAIEEVINPRTDLFQNITEFHIIDESGFRSTFGVFLSLLKNLYNLEIIKINSEDRNLNVLFEEFLPCMPILKEIYLKLSNNKKHEKLYIIKNTVSSLRKLIIAEEFINEAKNIFHDTNVNILSFNTFTQ